MKWFSGRWTRTTQVALMALKGATLLTPKIPTSSAADWGIRVRVGVHTEKAVEDPYLC